MTTPYFDVRVDVSKLSSLHNFADRCATHPTNESRQINFQSRTDGSEHVEAHFLDAFRRSGVCRTLALLAGILLSSFGTSHGFEMQPSDCVILSFSGQACGACRALQPDLHEAITQGWVIRSIDAERDMDWLRRWKVNEIPTLIVLENGAEVRRATGANATALIAELTGKAAEGFTNTTPLAHSDGRRAGGEGSSTRSIATDPMQVSVRIRIEDGNTLSYGTGTVIDQYESEALVLTCGHLFRGLTPNHRISVEVPEDGRLVSCPGQVIDYQFQTADIGLVSFRASRKLAVAKLVGQGESLREGDRVCSVGCDHGADPSRRDSQITKLNRYLGAPNVEVAKAPVQGRSGGGLFNDRGELIGVCYAAEPTLDEGLYSAPEVVYTQLNRLGLSRLYDRSTSSLAQSSGLRSTNTFESPLANSYGRGAGGEGPSSTFELSQNPATSPNTRSVSTIATSQSFPDESFRKSQDSAIQATVTSEQQDPNNFLSRVRTLSATMLDESGMVREFSVANPSPELLREIHQAAVSSKFTK